MPKTRKSSRRATTYTEEDEQVMEEDERRTKPRKKSKRVKVMSESGQTDSERRNLRSQQRNIAKQIAQGSELSEQLADASTGALEEVRNENNALWDNVKYTREAVLDGENVQEISTRAARQVDKLINVSIISSTNKV